MTAPTPAAPPAAGAAAPALLCGHCGYDLRGAAGRCTECGRPFDPAHTIDALIPWEQRRHIGRLGRVRAWVRTAWLVTFRSRAAARYLRHPVSFAAARRFRRVTAGVILIQLLAAAFLGASQVSARQPRMNDWRNEPALVVLNRWSLAVAVIGLCAGVLTATRLTAALFDRRALPHPQRQRATALGQYACAPAAVVVTTVAVAAALYGLVKNVFDRGDFLPILVDELLDRAPIIATLLAVLWVGSTLSYLRAVTGCGWRRLLPAAFALPAVWLACVAVLPALGVVAAALLVLLGVSLAGSKGP